MEKAILSLPLQALQYLLTGEIDDSCKAIIAHTTGLPTSDWMRRHHPVSVESIRRCRLLLERCPGVSDKFPSMAEISSEWAKIVDGWGDLCTVMDNECSNWRRTLWQDAAWQGQETRAVLQKLFSK